MIRDYVREMLEPSLLFGIAAALLGIAAASYYGHLNARLAVIAVAGVLLAQMAANLIDDYTDYTRGIDKETVKTKFSGGSAALASGKVKPTALLIIGVAAAAIAGLTGLYLLGVDPQLLPIIAIGGVSIFLYAAFLIRLPFVAEPLMSLNFAIIPIGTFIVAHGSAADLGGAIFAMVPAGMMVGLAFLANSMPDRPADSRHGRRNAVVMLGDKAKVSTYYAAWGGVAGLIVVYGILSGALPATFLITLITVPVAAKVYGGIRSYKDPQSHERFMGMSALFTMGFMFLCSASYLLAMIV